MANRIKHMCHGKAHTITWGVHEKVGSKALTYLLVGFEGFHIRSWTYDKDEKGHAPDHMEQDVIDRDFDFLEENIPKLRPKDHPRWLTKQVSTPDSPIFQWKDTLAELENSLIDMKIL